jgi:iron-sulfur cluster assembly protein
VPALLTVSDNAAKKAKSLLEKIGKPGAAIRVKVISGGCSGMEYQIAPDDAPARPGDTVIEDKGIKVYLDAKGLLYLAGTEMDYVSSLTGSGFKMKNPNAVAECSCGQSFTV